MINKTYFPVDASIRTVLALRCNSVVQHCTALLMTERDAEVVSDIVRDISRINDIMINYIGFGSITDNDIQWLLEACDRMDLFTSTEQMLDTEVKFEQIMAGK